MELKSLPKKILLAALMLLVGSTLAYSQDVGIGEANPNSKLDIVQTGATGNTVEVNHTTTTNASSAVFVVNAGTGRAVNAVNFNTASNIPTGQFQQQGTGATAYGVEVDMDVNSTAAGVIVFQDGTNDGVISAVSGTGYGMYVQNTGTGGGVYNDINGTGTLGTVNDISVNGGTGSYSFFNGQAGNAFEFDSIGTQGFGVFGIVNTTVPTGGGLVYGAGIGLVQQGVGHGILINHLGATGRNAEFNINNTNNADAAVFSIHSGPGPALLAQNVDNTIAGTIAAVDVGYYGTDIADHVGLQAYSAPAANWGYGIVGQGSWYGVYAVGNMGCSGVKTFLIDHPADPANQMLRHFSTESDEVLNMYRGMIQLDGNGEAIVELPDYFPLVNKNFSYQLTPVGTPVQPYVAQEIQGKTFKVAGAPNTKVSWMVLAERNDPYLQQHPELRTAEVVKNGERSGKYLMPELYNVDPKQGNFYHGNTASTKSMQGSQLIRPTTSQDRAQFQRDIKLQRAAAEPSK